MIKSADKDSLGDRMKGYESISRIYLTKRMPCIIRVDGKAFHTFTRGFQKPFDEVFIKSMQETAQYLCKNIQGCKFSYIQSDEISLLLTDYDGLTTSAWFDKNIQKIVSVSASMATLAFNTSFANNAMKWHSTFDFDNVSGSEEEVIIELSKAYSSKFFAALFDSRVFVIPAEDVSNYFIWRQQDATRNAIQMVGRANFSHKELEKLNCNQIQEKLFQERGINFNDFSAYQKRGACTKKVFYRKEGIESAMRCKWDVDLDTPIFAQNRTYIEQYI